MPWIDTKTKKQVTEHEIRNAHSETIFAAKMPAEDVEPFGYVWREPTPPTSEELAADSARALEEAEDAADKAGVFNLPRTEFLAKIDKMLQTPEGTQRLIKMMARIVRKVN